MLLRETPQFAMGRDGETTVARWLQERGWYVVPSYDYAGDDGAKAPRLQGQRSGYALPDLDVAKDGFRFWVEVKAKSGPTLHKKSGVLEHGISKRLLGHYLAVQRITGCRVFVLVHEQDAGLLLGRSLDELGPPRLYDGRKMGESGMAFWPRNRFRVMARMNEAEAA